MRDKILNLIWKVTRWFTRDWWGYLLEVGDWPQYHSKIGWPGFTKFFCRARGHAGIVFYNPGGWEPDYHCKHCGDDLG